MTGLPYDDDSAAADASVLRDRFESAVAGYTPDVGQLVAGGLDLGRGAVRRRRTQGGVAAAAVAVLAVGGISLASHNDLFGSKDVGPTQQGDLVQLEPASPQGMAAALLAHTKDLGTPIAVAGKGPGADQDGQLTAEAAFTLDDGTGVELDVFASPDLSQWKTLACDDPSSVQNIVVCDPFTLDDGSSAYYLEYGGQQVDSGSRATKAAGVVVKRDDQLLAVVETVVGSDQLVVSRDELTAIVADPAVGLSTTEALNALGDAIPKFQQGDLLDESSGSGSSEGNSTGSGSSGPEPTESSATASSDGGAASGSATNPVGPVSSSASANSGG